MLRAGLGLDEPRQRPAHLSQPEGHRILDLVLGPMGLRLHGRAQPLKRGVSVVRPSPFRRPTFGHPDQDPAGLAPQHLHLAAHPRHRHGRRRHLRRTVADGDRVVQAS